MATEIDVDEALSNELAKKASLDDKKDASELDVEEKLSNQLANSSLDDKKDDAVLITDTKPVVKKKILKKPTGEIKELPTPPSNLKEEVKVEKEEEPKLNTIGNITCPADVIDGHLITKDKRQEHFGQVAGGAGSTKPEEYQRKKIIEGTGSPCPKTNIRINLRTNTLKDISNPNSSKNTLNDGFDYSEDFDGIQTIGSKKIYINLKCIVGKGGAQTRSLREVYWFIEGQLKSLAHNTDTYFANILDGDEPHACMSKFNYLLSLAEYADVKKNIYIGDLKGYFGWLIQTLAQ